MEEFFEETAGAPVRRILARVCAALVLAIALIGSVPTAYAADFADVPEDYWAAPAIQYVAERGLFNGAGSNEFEPLENMSWAMLSTVLYRYAGSPEVSGPAPYEDVPEGRWYTDGVAWACENGIFPAGALESPLLEPEKDVRRAEFCIMLYNFAAALGEPVPGRSAPAETGAFADVTPAAFDEMGCGALYDEAETAMLRWAVPLEIMNGVSDTAINPLGSITRAEAAAMVSRFDLNVLGGTEAPPRSVPDQIPGPTPAPEPAAVPRLIPAQLVLQNPELPNGCEAVSLTMLLSCTGVQADKMDVYANYLPKTPFTWKNGVRFGPDPQTAYAGDASLKNGGWYCFENPVIAAGSAWLKANSPSWSMVNCTGLGQTELEECLAGGVPMVVWATLKCQTPKTSRTPWTLPGGSRYYPYTNLHCFLLTGISDGKYVAADPIYGWQYLNPAAFWGVFDSMGRRAVTLAPAAGESNPY